ncbi:MAG TPA: hypothetical protein VES64_04320 [Allosphingosinicella sp.]|nr:hypothetical protein [Allosphingosinicella sp.]
MRLTNLLLTAAAAGLLATAAAAQDADPPAGPASNPAPQAEQPASGLSDLRDTVQGLQDEAPALAVPPAEAPAAPAETPAPVPPPPPPPVSAPPQPLTAVQRAALEEAAVRGRLLGAIAAAGQIATRDMLSRVSDPAGAGISGWIAEPAGNGVTVTFYADGAAGAAPATVFRANIAGGRVVGRDVFLAGTRPPLNPVQARMAAARAATGALDHAACGGEDFNVFVVPPAAPDGPIHVYQISPQSRRGHFPIGGHYKTSVAADGSVASSRGFTNACLDAAVAEPVAGARPAPIAVTHLLDPLPTEIHVFLAIWTGHPLVVVAGDPQRLFAVTPGGIAEVPR